MKAQNDDGVPFGNGECARDGRYLSGDRNWKEMRLNQLISDHVYVAGRVRDDPQPASCVQARAFPRRYKSDMGRAEPNGSSGGYV